MSKPILYKCWMIFGLLMFGSLYSTASLVAQELTLRQQLLMPGPLISNHAELETECSNCHTSFDKQEMTTSCLDCHEDIATDRTNKLGFHGQSPLAANDSCNTCHTDHEGRDAEVDGLSTENFDHSNTRFELTASHQTLSCESCHEEDKKYREAKSTCNSCHNEKDIHNGVLGTECESCHQSNRWQTLLAFDHSSTDFNLLGQHENIACSSCHIAQQFEFSETTCVSCHKANDIHAGTNGNQCESCHQEGRWDQLSFNHEDTNFSLLGKHADIPCRACHTSDQERDQTPTTCISCHESEDIHFGRNGTQCESCHNSQRWQQITFDHNSDTDYPLTGLHENVSCANCHTDTLEKDLARDCQSCHASDDVHRESSMKLCGTCHNTQGWNTISQFDHDFTSMPLIGMHEITPCQSCHIGNQFASTNNECESCHADSDVHQGALGTNCNECHSPNAWNIWQFDHEIITGYILEGKHQGLACDACHKPKSRPHSTSTSCGSCHRVQDVHNGGFGDQCDRCHGTTNFFELHIQ